MRVLIRVLLWGIVLVPANSGFPFSWPFADSRGNSPNAVGFVEEQQKLRSFLGSYRLSHNYFHAGIDMCPTFNSNIVYARNSSPVIIRAGNVNKVGTENEYVTIEGLIYMHVELRPDIKDLVNNGGFVVINPGDRIGVMKHWTGGITDHVHSRFEGNRTNPIFSLEPFKDEANPVVDGIWLSKQGESTTLLDTNIYGKLDMRVCGYDVIGWFEPDVPGYLIRGDLIDGRSGGSAVPVTIGYVIRSNEDNRVLYDPIANTRWVTNLRLKQNEDPEDSYWNTKQRIDEAISIDARINSEAQTPDGFVLVQAYLADTKGNVNDPKSHELKRLIDNFVPYVASLKITQSKSVVYEGAWPTTPADDTHLVPLPQTRPNVVEKSVSSNTPMEISVVFSEPMSALSSGTTVFLKPTMSFSIPDLSVTILSVTFSTTAVTPVCSVSRWTNVPGRSSCCRPSTTSPRARRVRPSRT
jgi:hypothetical protein